NQKLQWKDHAAYALTKSTSYTLLLRRLSSSLWDIPVKLMHQLYQSVAIPRATYAVAIWIQPLFSHMSPTLLKGSKGIASKLVLTQRTTTIAITGAMRTVPTDSLNILANLIPTHLMLQQ
ncbi:hypothetical protein J3A83DRAFT_4076049, partial [Scleroderma citrinum]